MTSPPPTTTALTGARLIHLADGREFPVGADPVVLGRHSTADIWLQGPSISRRHAEIRLTPEGCLLADLSVNGTLLNGQRITEARLLLSGDLIRVGDHELRYEPAAMAGEPPSGGPASATSLATLLVCSGAHKGTTIPIYDPMVDIGRAPGNQIIFREDGVSTEHARLVLGDAGWVLVDRGSTNGSFIDGERIHGTRAIPPGATLSLGEVSAVFQPADPETLAAALRRKRRRSTGKYELVAELPGQPDGKLGKWLRRYGVAEIVGTLTAFAGSYAVDALTDNPVAAAYGGSVGETVGFYGTIIIRELVHDAHAAGLDREPYGLRESIRTARNILMEFGVAEVLDTGVLRPLFMGLGTQYLGRQLGILVGKLVSDLTFYAPVILAYEIRTMRRASSGR